MKTILYLIAFTPITIFSQESLLFENANHANKILAIKGKGKADATPSYKINWGSKVDTSKCMVIKYIKMYESQLDSVRVGVTCSCDPCAMYCFKWVKEKPTYEDFKKWISTKQ